MSRDKTQYQRIGNIAYIQVPTSLHHHPVRSTNALVTTVKQFKAAHPDADISYRCAAWWGCVRFLVVLVVVGGVF
jgi:hypothetical protein